ncbi:MULTISPECIES: GntR family transcriptional regulator [Saccharothrix]|uniref:GntR family transcriptional regulator n=1 Tax=Saccharothrix TaxID=2071 RepID=UPI001160EB73|nr:GntR family transcriptional regulator [Saccharothrix sp. CB00851]
MHYDDGMEPQRTTARQPLALKIADDLRIRIETGKLRSGDSLPPLHELVSEYGCSTGTARAAMGLLRQQGLVVGGRGKPLTVRPRPKRVERSSARHQVEKNLVLQSEDVRRNNGLAENDMGSSFDDFDFEAKYSIVPADADLSDAFGVPDGTSLLRREFTHSEKKTGVLAAWSVSWLPVDLIRSNPDISDPANAKWPGGTMHQLYTVGIEVEQVIDHVTAAMPTTVQMDVWNLAEGTPLLWVRRISIDTSGRVVEVSDAQFPSDRTMLTFNTQLERWDATK